MRKADFQMSMGFIIAVVFAIILLSLSITWIQGLFGDIGSITHKTTDVAQQNLLENLASSGNKVGIAAPAVTSWSEGETGSYAIGIKNADVDGEHTYYMNVYISAVGGALAGEDPDGWDNKATKWLTYPPSKDLPAGEKDIVDLIIKPDPVTAEPGIYTFTVAVCHDDPVDDTSTCHGSDHPDFNTRSENLYGTATFAIEISN